MIVDFFDWSGTITVLIAAFVFAMKRAYKPKLRLIGFTFFLISNCFVIPLAIMKSAEGLLFTQIVLLVINIRGIINCYKEYRAEF
jgi:hypothetical protein